VQPFPSLRSKQRTDTFVRCPCLWELRLIRFRQVSTVRWFGAVCFSSRPSGCLCICEHQPYSPKPRHAQRQTARLYWVRTLGALSKCQIRHCQSRGGMDNRVSYPATLCIYASFGIMFSVIRAVKFLTRLFESYISTGIIHSSTLVKSQSIAPHMNLLRDAACRSERVDVHRPSLKEVQHLAAICHQRSPSGGGVQRQ
jgi:hypothetical protein